MLKNSRQYKNKVLFILTIESSFSPSTVTSVTGISYPNHLGIQDSASRERAMYKALIEKNGCSIVEINNAGDDPLSPCPAGDKLEHQCCVAILYKGITIICVPRLALIS